MSTEISDLQEKIAHLTRAVDDLSDIVREQGTLLDQQSRRLRILLEREAEREAEAGTPVPLTDQRPPHW
tara:strand:- start:46 stop:252 length:207 start_codon:yes stop_codon:yes gene_type:complete